MRLVQIAPSYVAEVLDGNHIALIRRGGGGEAAKAPPPPWRDVPAWSSTRGLRAILKRCARSEDPFARFGRAFGVPYDADAIRTALLQWPGEWGAVGLAPEVPEQPRTLVFRESSRSPRRIIVASCVDGGPGSHDGWSWPRVRP